MQNTCRQQQQAVLKCNIRQRDLRIHNKSTVVSLALNKPPDSSWTAWPWRWRLYALPKRRKLFTRRHGVTLQKSFTFINDAERTSALINGKQSLAMQLGTVYNFEEYSLLGDIFYDVLCKAGLMSDHCLRHCLIYHATLRAISICSLLLVPYPGDWHRHILYFSV